MFSTSPLIGRLIARVARRRDRTNAPHRISNHTSGDRFVAAMSRLYSQGVGRGF